MVVNSSSWSIEKARENIKPISEELRLKEDVTDGRGEINRDVPW